MNQLKGYRLYVPLSASQARRRLRGYGFGVRKVQSAGRGQAVIIHTATGQHLRELEMLFDIQRDPVDNSFRERHDPPPYDKR